MMKFLSATIATALARDHFGPVLPRAVERFYDAIEDAGRSCATALQHFTEDAVWVHTGVATAMGPMKIQEVFLNAASSKITDTTTVDSIGNDFAQSVIVTRQWGNMYNHYKRESFFLVGGKIKAVWTTLGSPNDPKDETGQHPWEGRETSVAGGGNSPGEDIVVQQAVEVYFEGFTGKNPNMMASAYWEDPIYMFDFNPVRQTPFGCSVSEDCATAPYFNAYDQLLPAFSAFTSEPSHIELNRQFENTALFGEIAFVSTTSYGCEGIYVTPDGTAAMPNREIFVVVKRDGKWKVKSYMFTFDPAPVLSPPTQTCYNNGAVVV